MRKVFASALVLALLASAATAAAEPAPTGAETAVQVTVAKALLEEGKKLAREGHPKEALDKLGASVEKDPTPEALLKLAACQEKLGTTASAWGTFHRAEERARTLGDQPRARHAARGGAALAPKLSRVRVVVTEADEPPTVTLDNRELEKDAWGVPLPLDPGSHTVAATAPGKLPFWKNIELAAAQSVDVTVPVLSAPTPPPPLAHLPEAPPKPSWPTPQAEGVFHVPPSPSGSVALSPAPKSAPGSENKAGAIAVILIAIAGSCATGVGIAIAGQPHPSAADERAGVVTAAIGAGFPIAFFISLMTSSIKSRHTTLLPLPLRAEPLVASSGGGLSLHGVF